MFFSISDTERAKKRIFFDGFFEAFLDVFQAFSKAEFGLYRSYDN